MNCQQFFLLLGSIGLASLASCVPSAGPLKRNIETSDANRPYNLVAVHSRADLPTPAYSEMGSIPASVKGGSYSDKVRVRDSLRFVITDLTEQSPFFNKNNELGPVEVPEDGRVSLPYVGEIQVLDQTLAQITSDLNAKLKPISSTAQASVARSGRIARTANVIGEVKNPGPVPLERTNITSHDILSASGGPTSSDYLYKYTLRRNGQDYVFDSNGFRQKPFAVEEGDLLTVVKDPNKRFYVMGAINKPTTVPFPVAQPTLADALGAASGLDQMRSDPSGVFVFRKGEPDTVFTIDMKDPAAVLLTQRFPIRSEDIVYVTEAPLTRWNRLISQLLPTTQGTFFLTRIHREATL